MERGALDKSLSSLQAVGISLCTPSCLTRSSSDEKKLFIKANKYICLCHRLLPTVDLLSNSNYCLFLKLSLTFSSCDGKAVFLFKVCSARGSQCLSLQQGFDCTARLTFLHPYVPEKSQILDGST